MRFLRCGWRDSGSAFCVHDALQHRINFATSRLDRHGLNISIAVESVFLVCQLVRNADFSQIGLPEHQEHLVELCLCLARAPSCASCKHWSDHNVVMAKADVRETEAEPAREECVQGNTAQDVSRSSAATAKASERRVRSLASCIFSCISFALLVCRCSFCPDW